VHKFSVKRIEILTEQKVGEYAMCNRGKRWCLMHLSFTREIHNLRVNSSAQRQLALQFANSALNNTVPRETLVWARWRWSV